MKYLVVILHSLIFILMSGCDEGSSQVDPYANKVAGEYVATTFIMPGKNDGFVDILDNGGMLTAILTMDFKVSGRMKMPSHPNLNGEGFDENYTGTFLIKKDSLQFFGTDNALSHPQLSFAISDSKLEGVLIAQTTRKIVLTRKTF